MGFFIVDDWTPTIWGLAGPSDAIGPCFGKEGVLVDVTNERILFPCSFQQRFVSAKTISTHSKNEQYGYQPFEVKQFLGHAFYVKSSKRH